VPTPLFGSNVDQLWFTVALIPGFTLPPGLILNSELGEVYGTRCLGVNASFYVRASLGDASTLCRMNVLVHENSGVAECPVDAAYADTTEGGGDEYDGTFSCKCRDVTETWDVNTTSCNNARVCTPLNLESSPSNNSDDMAARRTLGMALAIPLLLLLCVALALLAGRRRGTSHVADKDWSCVTPAPYLEMKPHEMTVNAKLGSGQFGVVNHVTVDVKKRGLGWNNMVGGSKSGSRKAPTKGNFACKRCAGDAVTNKDRDEFVAEMAIAIDMDHKNVLRTVGIITQCGPDELCMLTELCGRDMHVYLRDRQPNNLGAGVSQVEMLQFCLETAEGLHYLAGKQFVHRDIACRNLLLTDPERSVKIADFGLSRRVGARNYYRKTTEGMLPIRWMAPEAIHKSIYTPQSDIFAMAVVFWEVWTYADVPYASMSSRQVIEEVNNGYRLPKPRLMEFLNKPDLDLYALMLQCWSERPSSRPQHTAIIDMLRQLVVLSKLSNDGATQNRQYTVPKRSITSNFLDTTAHQAGGGSAVSLAISHASEEIVDGDAMMLRARRACDVQHGLPSPGQLTWDDATYNEVLDHESSPADAAIYQVQPNYGSPGMTMYNIAQQPGNQPTGVSASSTDYYEATDGVAQEQLYQTAEARDAAVPSDLYMVPHAGTARGGEPQGSNPGGDLGNKSSMVHRLRSSFELTESRKSLPSSTSDAYEVTALRKAPPMYPVLHTRGPTAAHSQRERSLFHGAPGDHVQQHTIYPGGNRVPQSAFADDDSDYMDTGPISASDSCASGRQSAETSNEYVAYDSITKQGGPPTLVYPVTYPADKSVCAPTIQLADGSPVTSRRQSDPSEWKRGQQTASYDPFLDSPQPTHERLVSPVPGWKKGEMRKSGSYVPNNSAGMPAHPAPLLPGPKSTQNTKGKWTQQGSRTGPPTPPKPTPAALRSTQMQSSI
jgi:serine/threonine protein kinase